MPNKSELESTNQEKSPQTSPMARSDENDQEEISKDSAATALHQSRGSRKAALSKREMMEELSRQRFPWEE